MNTILLKEIFSAVLHQFSGAGLKTPARFAVSMLVSLMIRNGYAFNQL